VGHTGGGAVDVPSGESETRRAATAPDGGDEHEVLRIHYLYLKTGNRKQTNKQTKKDKVNSLPY
jgi:hypothetical protein